jgi:hypothetical protein
MQTGLVFAGPAGLGGCDSSGACLHRLFLVAVARPGLQPVFDRQPGFAVKMD